MRTVTPETLTETFLNYCGPDTDPRLMEILTSLATHLHAFVKEVTLTHEEWRRGIELMMRAGEISGPERNEFVLFSDILGLSSLVDMVNSATGATSSSVLGPFHVLGAPPLPVGGDLKQENAGDALVLEGQVTDTDGTPIPGAAIEIWQTADNGLYSGQDPGQEDYNLRARLTVGADGRYLFSTVRPAPYTVPDDGPAGELLKSTGRKPWRPSHLHFIVEAEGFRTLVTEVFPEDDPYLDEDAVFGVREDLVMRYRPTGRREDLPTDLAARDTLSLPVQKVDFDFVLTRA